MNKMTQMMSELKAKVPLVHCMTNYVTVNDCANALLAIGASPIMADEIKEVEDIISICDALVINIGTLNERSVESMILAGKKANELGKPVVLDPVGNGASAFRTETTNRILKEIKLTTLRGNVSEIKMAYTGMASTRGVDANAQDSDTMENQIEMAKNLAKELQCVVAITGKEDIVADGKRVYTVRNGNPLMGKITGTGCMCSCLIGAFLATFDRALEASAAAISLMGLAGELAYAQNIGTGSYRVGMIDKLSLINDQAVMAGRKIEAK